METEAETAHAYRPYKKESRTCEGSIKIPEECPRINAFKVVGPRIAVSDQGSVTSVLNSANRQLCNLSRPPFKQVQMY